LYPVLFTVFGFPVEAFWATVFLGFLAALFVARAELVRQGHDPGHAYDLILWSYIGGFVGARLFLVFTEWDKFWRDPIGLLFSGSGWVWQGGVIGGAVTVILTARRLGLPLGDVADLAGPCLAIGQAIGRIGCQLAGDGDYGIPTTVPWGMSYPDGVVPTTDTVHPTPVYEAAAYFLIFAVLWRRRAAPHVRGTTFAHYLLYTGVVRFAVEFVRRNHAVALGLTVAQWVSVVSVVIGAVILWRLNLVKTGPGAQLNHCTH
jgi:phosphatidylglycerol:prolipoprotein diacylglycerol transferase